jgi:pimeloyl-ACP methyl ester carboxylesterase
LEAPRHHNPRMLSGLFLPGWGASAGLYRRGLPCGWTVLDPPAYALTHGDLGAYREWVGGLLGDRSEPVRLAGHSMGAALALLAAAARPERVKELVLLAPAGLPLDKSLPASAATFVAQIARRAYPAGEICRCLLATARAPRAALRLARTIHRLDLSAELEPIRSHRIRCTVIGCRSDTLTTTEHSRRLAALLGARYRELDASQGHIWMIADPGRLAAELAA